jgi:branched-chain amino acid transport system permease protein
LLIIIAPVEPMLDRAHIGRTFCVVVMAGLGSMSGTLIAGIILGVAESIVVTMFGASWAPKRPSRNPQSTVRASLTSGCFMSMI